MAFHYLLIDFENVQPTNWASLLDHSFKVLVFIGPKQTKLPIDFAAAMQALGDSVQYIKIANSGKNALDFHIAYYVGELASRDPGAMFHIISADKGFDPLIQHLNERNIQVRRVLQLTKSPAFGTSTTKSVADPMDEQISAVINNLYRCGNSRPRKVRRLANAINALFTNRLSEQQMAILLERLEQRKYIKINEDRISYYLPH